jgi:2-polyprenyl-3-methyl-5-hydroxy-6-metoxy-1,4-benzoquinol methylase
MRRCKMLRFIISRNTKKPYVRGINGAENLLLICKKNKDIKKLIEQEKDYTLIRSKLFEIYHLKFSCYAIEAVKYWLRNVL